MPETTAPRPDPDDAELVHAALAGRVTAFGQLHDRYARLVHALSYDVTGNLHEAQDLAQEVFLRAHAQLSRLHRPERFGTWLMRIAHNACRDWQRQRIRQRRHLRLLESPPAPSGPAANAAPVADDPAVDAAELEALRRAVASLPRKERLALHLFYLEERSADQARTLLRLSRAGFYRVLERARRRLRGLLQQYREDQP